MKIFWTHRDSTQTPPKSTGPARTPQGYILNRENGFTMVELIITIVILSFGIIGVYGAFSPLISLNYNISSRFKAAYLGQEGLEIIRNIRDNNFIKNLTWSSGLTSCSQGCQADYKTGTAVETFNNQLKPYDPPNFLKINIDGFYSYDSGDNTIFKRKITITQPLGTDTLKVDVQVFWNYNDQPFNYETIGYLYNWH